MLVGLDGLQRSQTSQQRRRLAEGRLGVLTHSAAVDGKGRQTLEVLHALSITPARIFSPEHGLDGLAEAEEPVGTDDADVGEASLVSLYGATRESLTPSPQDLEGLEFLLIDLVDVGSRYYTYLWTALLAARAAADANIHTIVLDRPNPLSGNVARLEGRPQDPDLCSFVGLEPLPVRHCMTIAEILSVIFNQEDRPLGKDGALSVLPTEGWERHRLATAQGRPFLPPSPNMPTVETALLYPGGCLLEGTNLSEGRGTTRPFHLVGAPYLSAPAFAQAVGDIPGAWVRPARFKPTFDKHAGKICEGISLHVTDESRFRPVAAYLRVIAAARRLAPDDFKLLDRVYEFETEHRAFDVLTGTRKAGQLVEEGAPAEELIELLAPAGEEWVVTVETAEELVDEIRA